MPSSLSPASYSELIAELKARIQAARMRATLAVNQELVLLYWDIGRSIASQQADEGWGSKVIARLSADLRVAFPDMKGLSPRNLLYMRQFADAWPDREIAQQAAAQIPWSHNCVLLDRLDDPAARLWYVRSIREHGWSRAVLTMQLDTRVHERQGKALSNFERTLPAPESDLANALLKDPYIFGFLGLEEDAQERELEKALVRHIRDFLLELGVGFAFMGTQYRLEIAGDEFFIDMLFYHHRLRCFVVIELKTVEFKPEFVGKLSFYLRAVDEQVKHPDDGPSIGLLLCKTKNRLVVEYALWDTTRPMGVAEYQLVESLPDNLRGSLPTVEELEATLDAVDDDEEAP